MFTEVRHLILKVTRWRGGRFACLSLGSHANLEGGSREGPVRSRIISTDLVSVKWPG